MHHSWLGCRFVAVLGTGFVRGGGCTDTTSPLWYAPANPHAPTGPAWPKVSPRGSFAPLGVPTGQVEHRGSRGRRAAEIPELALMSALRGSIIGSIMYAAQLCRPDVLCTVCRLGRYLTLFCSNAKILAWSKNSIAPWALGDQQLCVLHTCHT